MWTNIKYGPGTLTVIAFDEQGNIQLEVNGKGFKKGTLSIVSEK